MIAAYDGGSILRRKRAAAHALEHEENTDTGDSTPLPPGNNILQTRIHPQSFNNPTSSDNNSTSLQHFAMQVHKTHNVSYSCVVQRHLDDSNPFGSIEIPTENH